MATDLTNLSIALITRTYAGAADGLLPALSRCTLTHIAGLNIEIVIVLDDTPSDHSLGNTLLAWHSEEAEAGQLKVFYEAPLDKHRDSHSRERERDRV